MKKRSAIRLVLALLSLCTAVAWAGIPPPVIRKGKVLDAESGAPVSDVEVVAYIKEVPQWNIEPETLMTRTDSLGEYRLAPCCKADFVFSKTGYHTKMFTWPEVIGHEKKRGCCLEFQPVFIQRARE